MDEALIVRRWSRFGADRLYVTAGNGQRVGVVDLLSGEVSVDLPVLEEGVRRAAQAFLRQDVTELVLPFESDLDLDDALEGSHEQGELARSERAASVRSRLERLTEEGWHAVHAVPLGRQGTTVEHLLVGPGGIFTVTERVHPGERIHVDSRTIDVEGRPVPYLRDARLEAARVESLLRAAVGSQLAVRAVLVLQGIIDMRPDTHPDDAMVIPRRDVPRLFLRLPERLEPARVDAIAAIARQRTTWAH